MKMQMSGPTSLMLHARIVPFLSTGYFHALLLLRSFWGEAKVIVHCGEAAKSQIRGKDDFLDLFSSLTPFYSRTGGSGRMY